MTTALSTKCDHDLLSIGPGAGPDADSAPDYYEDEYLDQAADYAELQFDDWVQYYEWEPVDEE